MAEALAAPPADAPWHARLQERLAAAESAVAALLAVCEEPDARAALEVRASLHRPTRAACTCSSGAHAYLPAVRLRELSTHAARSGAATQARDFGWLDAATAVHVDAAALLRRTDLVTDRMRRVRASLAWRAPAVSRAGGSRHGALGFAALPHAVALRIFALLPADARARATVVSRAWRAIVLEPSLWARLDLSHSSGVKRPVWDAVLRGAAALARGVLKVLVLDDCVEVSRGAQLDVLVANAGSLRELSCRFSSTVLVGGSTEELSLRVPQLQLFQADTQASIADAIRMLRNEPPFGALRLCRLDMLPPATNAIDEATTLQLAAAISGHASLRELYVSSIPLDTPAMLDAVTAAVVACRLRNLLLNRCRLSPASVPALVRLIRGGALTSFHISNNFVQLLDEPAAVQLADAVAASRTLTRFLMNSADLWRDGAAAAAVLRALTGHPTLDEISLIANPPHDPVAAGAALGALVAANTPALRLLRVGCSLLGDAGLAPLCDALPHNTHLRSLRCSNNGMSAEFARDRFVPAVRANTSLRMLDASELWDNQEDGVAPPEVVAAEVLVGRRAPLDS